MRMAVSSKSRSRPRDPPAPDKRQTALFSHLDKNTVIEKKVSGHRVTLLVSLSTVSTYRVFEQLRNLTVFTSHNDLSFSISHLYWDSLWY